jgi:GNAT superfamily N-acetyltransferase
VTLRSAQPGDIGRVRAIMAGAARELSAQFGEGHWSRVRTPETLRTYVAQGTLYLVEMAGAVIGTLRLTDRKIPFYRTEWFADPKASAGYLLDTAIDPPHQQRGHGRCAMRMVEDIARSYRMKAVRLDAYGGPAGAGAFYEKCGYSLTHRGTFNGVALEYFEKLL